MDHWLQVNFLWYIAYHPRLSCNDASSNPQFKLGHAWVKISLFYADLSTESMLNSSLVKWKRPWVLFETRMPTEETPKFLTSSRECLLLFHVNRINHFYNMDNIFRKNFRKNSYRMPQNHSRWDDWLWVIWLTSFLVTVEMFIIPPKRSWGGRGILDLSCSSVRPFVRPSVRPPSVSGW